MDRELTEILKAKGTIIKDKTNVNGRFVTVKVAGSPRKVAWELVKELPLAFPLGYFSEVPSCHGGGVYHVQANSKRPRFVSVGSIYPAGSFGVCTEIDIVR